MYAARVFKIVLERLSGGYLVASQSAHWDAGALSRSASQLYSNYNLLRNGRESRLAVVNAKTVWRGSYSSLFRVTFPALSDLNSIDARLPRECSGVSILYLVLTFRLVLTPIRPNSASYLGMADLDPELYTVAWRAPLEIEA